jgi:hypothetical protein
MPSSLRQQLSELASSFASDVLDAIRSASIDDLLAETSAGAPPVHATTRRPGRAERPAGRATGKPGRIPRRSAKDIAGLIDRIAVLLRQSPKGLRAEDIRKKLGVRANELPRPLKEGVQAGRLSKSGRKRATVYVLKGASPAKAPRPTRAPVKAARATKAARAAAAPAPVAPAATPATTSAKTSRAVKPARKNSPAKKK